MYCSLWTVDCGLWIVDCEVNTFLRVPRNLEFSTTANCLWSCISNNSRLNMFRPVACLTLGSMVASSFAYVVPAELLRRQDTSSGTSSGSGSASTTSSATPSFVNAGVATSTIPVITVQSPTSVDYWCQPLLDQNDLDALQALWEDKSVGEALSNWTTQSQGGDPTNWPYQMAKTAFDDLNVGNAQLGVCFPAISDGHQICISEWRPG